MTDRLTAEELAAMRQRDAEWPEHIGDGPVADRRRLLAELDAVRRERNGLLTCKHKNYEGRVFMDSASWCSRCGALNRWYGNEPVGWVRPSLRAEKEVIPDDQGGTYAHICGGEAHPWRQSQCGLCGDGPIANPRVRRKKEVMLPDASNKLAGKREMPASVTPAPSASEPLTACDPYNPTQAGHTNLWCMRCNRCEFHHAEDCVNHGGSDQPLSSAPRGANFLKDAEPAGGVGHCSHGEHLHGAKERCGPECDCPGLPTWGYACVGVCGRVWTTEPPIDKDGPCSCGGRIVRLVAVELK